MNGLSANEVTPVREITLGSVLPLSGPSAVLGNDLKRGFDSHFKLWNETQGKKLGIKINVLVRDDKYEPNLTYKETYKLIKNPKLFSLFSQVGTPTTEAIKELLKKENISAVGLFSGASLFREENQKTFFHIRASYEQEIDKIINYFLNNNNKKRFFIVHQSDSFGGSGKALVMKNLQKTKVMISGETSYQRNFNVSPKSIDDIIKNNPDVLMFIGTYGAFAHLIQETRKKGYKGEYATVSFVGTKGLVEKLGKISKPVYISEVMPNPFDRKLAIVRDYQETMMKNGVNQFDYGSFEGYLNALVFTKFIENNPNITEREDFFNQLRKFKINLSEIKIDFANSQQVSRKEVHLVKLQNGNLEELE